jgi:hypothetical protein
MRGHPCAQRHHGRGLLSERLRALIRALHRATVGGLIVDDDRGPRVALVLHLEDVRGEWDVLEAVVGPFAGDERFDDAVGSVPDMDVSSCKLL